MINPSPRPALKKAPDSAVHPAAPGVVPKRRPLGGATSDHLRVVPKPAKSSGGSSKKPKDKKQKLEKVTIELPKNVLKTAQGRAKQQGVSLDKVIGDLLATWIS